MSIAKNDNDTFILTPIKMTSRNHVKEFDGINIEAGSSKTNPSQNLGVAYIKYKRIH
jgi:predicted lactoylglutathione lyase